MRKETSAVAVLAVVLGLAGLGAFASRWLPPLLAFAGAHSDAIQGLTGLGQIALWAAAVGLAGYRFWRHGEERDPAAGSGATQAVIRDGAVAQGERLRLPAVRRALLERSGARSVDIGFRVVSRPHSRSDL